MSGLVTVWLRMSFSGLFAGIALKAWTGKGGGVT